jgi:hypothetical protein
MVESMSGVKHRNYLLISTFLLGICFGYLLVPDLRSRNAPVIDTDFCFLMHNPELFESRRFLTFAYISSAYPHGSVLDNPSCPDEIASFREEFERQDNVTELNQKALDQKHFSIPVLLEGMTYRSSFLKKTWFNIRTRLGLSGDGSRTITIRAIKAIGEQRWHSNEHAWESAQ